MVNFIVIPFLALLLMAVPFALAALAFRLVVAIGLKPKTKNNQYDTPTEASYHDGHPPLILLPQDEEQAHGDDQAREAKNAT